MSPWAVINLRFGCILETWWWQTVDRCRYLVAGLGIYWVDIVYLLWRYCSCHLRNLESFFRSWAPLITAAAPCLIMFSKVNSPARSLMPPRQTVQKIFCKTVSELDWEWEDEVRPSQKTAQLSSRCLQTPLLGISCDPTQNKSTDIYWYLQISTDIYLYLQVSVWPLVQRRLAAARMLINDVTTPPPEIRLQWGQEELYQPACQYLHTVDTLLSFSPLHQSAFSPSLVTSIKCSARTLAAAAMHFMELTTVCISCSISPQSSHLCRGLVLCMKLQLHQTQSWLLQSCKWLQWKWTVDRMSAAVSRVSLHWPAQGQGSSMRTCWYRGVMSAMATLSCREHSTNTDGIIHQLFLPGHCTQPVLMSYGPVVIII